MAAPDLIGTFEGTVVLNSIRLDETYLPPGTVTNNLFERTIPNQYVFIMGDNRAVAADSRVFGAMRRDQLIATVALRFWPLTDLGSP